MTTASIAEFTQFEQQSELLRMRHDHYIAPFWDKHVANGYFSGKDNLQIAYAYVLHPEAIGTIAISSGRIETLLKYKELVFNLYHAGYSVFIHDHRGQGLSDRMTPNPHQGYVETFDDYVTDFKIFYDKVITVKTQHQPIVLAHSMGSTIASLYMLKHPEDFAKAVLSAPMFGIKPVMPLLLACTITKFLLGLNAMTGALPWYFPGQADYHPDPFKGNTLTSCEPRYQIFRNEYLTNPNCQLGGVTSKWLHEAYLAMHSINKYAGAISVPVLLLQAGNDQIVDNRQQNRIAGKLENCQVVQLENAKHELFMEIDEIRDTCLRELLQFLR